MHNVGRPIVLIALGELKLLILAVDVAIPAYSIEMRDH